MNALNAAQLGLAASLVIYVVVIGLGRADLLRADIGFVVALGLIGTMPVCAAACLIMQGMALWHGRKPSFRRQ